MKNSELQIIAGPCSVDTRNIEEIYEISEIKVNGKKAISGTRIVGLKSRTSMDPNGDGMGMDYQVLMKNLDTLLSGGSTDDFEITQSVEITKDIIEKTGMMVASEIMMPLIQLPLLERVIGKNGKLMPWNPSVNQLGWSMTQVGKYAKRNGWNVGIKNGKWVGEDITEAERDNFEDKTPLEKTWSGLKDYVGQIDGDICFIQRGVDVPEKGLFRNLPIHNIAKRVKLDNPEAKMYFDPSHSYGPKMRGDIVEATIEAMKMIVTEEEYLYDGVLIEAGTSMTDTEQHISIDELKYLVEKVSEIRDVV